MVSLLKKPSAWAPIVLTGIILGMMLLYFAKALPPEPTSDEGIMANSFQLWAVLEFMGVIFFALKWLPKERHKAWKITFLQIVLAIIPFTIVWFLEH